MMLISSQLLYETTYRIQIVAKFYDDSRTLCRVCTRLLGERKATVVDCYPEQLDDGEKNVLQS
jgi:hypothetical protein